MPVRPVCRGCCREGSIIKKFYMDGGSILRAYEHKTPCSVLIPIRGAAVIKSPKFDSNSNGHSWGLLLRTYSCLLLTSKPLRFPESISGVKKLVYKESFGTVDRPLPNVYFMVTDKGGYKSSFLEP